MYTQGCHRVRGAPIESFHNKMRDPKVEFSKTFFPKSNPVMSDKLIFFNKLSNAIGCT